MLTLPNKIAQFVIFAANLLFLLANGAKIYFTSTHVSPPSGMTYLGLGLNILTALYFLPAVIRMFWRQKTVVIVQDHATTI